MKPSLRSRYIELVVQTRKPDGYSLEQRIASLNEVLLSADANPGLSTTDRTVIRKEVRDSIFVIQHPERASSHQERI